MLDRAFVVDEQFIKRVLCADFPPLLSTLSPKTVGLSKKTAIELFDSQIKSRLLDLIARQLKEKGLSFYTIGSSGHEGNAVLGHVFKKSDMAFLHYRSGALYLQRAKQVQGSDGVRDILRSLVAAAADPIDVGKKGGVYRVTADLQSRFGQRRVFDTLLDETTILGSAIGLAHNGFIPVPEIQFLAYLHNAEDQLRGEASTLSFFSNGQYKNPMIIRIASLAYQKGFGGHFHNDNSIAVLRDLPGVIIACPSNGSDAAKMLRTCMHLAAQEGRVIVFLEPIALYMTKDLHLPGDNAWLFDYPPPTEQIALGEIRVYGAGETVILSYANGYYFSRKAAKELKEQQNIDVKVIDLRWLSPLPKAALLKELNKAKRVLIVDEGRESASLSEGLMTFLSRRGPINAHDKTPDRQRLLHSIRHGLAVSAAQQRAHYRIGYCLAIN